MQYVTDDAGRLFDPGARAALVEFTGSRGHRVPEDEVLALLEAAAAVRCRSGGDRAPAIRRHRWPRAQRRRVRPAPAAAPSGDGGLPLGELALALGVTPRNVTGLVDTLEREGLVRRVPDPADRRSVRAVATAEGLAWLDAFRAPTRAAMAAVFAGFSPAEAAQLRDLCLRLVLGVRGVRER